MLQGGNRNAASVIHRMARRSRSTRAAKLNMMRGDDAKPDGMRRISYAHAASRHRTRVGAVESEDIVRMARSGLVASRAEDGAPAVTPMGRWSATASELGISFFEMCVLAKVYSIARSMEGAGEGGGNGGEGGARATTIPLKTVQYLFEDWPVYPGRVHHALSRLRSRGLIPRSRPKRIICDMGRLDAICGELSEVGRWVDNTVEEIRRVLLHGD